MRIRMIILRIPPNSHLLSLSDNIKESGFGAILAEVAAELMVELNNYNGLSPPGNKALCGHPLISFLQWDGEHKT